MQWTPVVLGRGANISVGAQGRYFTPFIILLLPLVANTAKLDLSRQKKLKIATLTLIANFLVAMYLIQMCIRDRVLTGMLGIRLVNTRDVLFMCQIS